jgi:2-aminoadipate transaminase
MVAQAIQRKVAYVIGSAFHCDGSGQRTMRLNFSFSSEEQIDEGIRRLAETIRG